MPELSELSMGLWKRKLPSCVRGTAKSFCLGFSQDSVRLRSRRK